MIKKFIRKLVIRLHYATKEWSVPPRVYVFINLGNYSDARRELRKAQQVYRYDPEITRLLYLISFLEKPKG